MEVISGSYFLSRRRPAISVKCGGNIRRDACRVKSFKDENKNWRLSGGLVMAGPKWRLFRSRRPKPKCMPDDAPT